MRSGKNREGDDVPSVPANPLAGYSKLLIVLGNRNDTDGKLSQTAELRCQKATVLLLADKGLVGLCTGAFGEFNQSNTPHGELMRRRLRALGVPKEQLLAPTQSRYTVSDAYAVLRMLKRTPGMREVSVLTSKFHMARTSFIFARVLQEWPLRFFEVQDPEENMCMEYEQDKKEEPDKFRREQEGWVDVSRFDLEKFPTAGYANLGQEHRHYDNLSIAALGAAGVVFWTVLTKDLFVNHPYAKGFQCGAYSLALLAILLFWGLYKRFADTAASARRVLKAVEELYGVPGLGSTPDQATFLLKYRKWEFLKVNTKRFVCFVIILMILTLFGKLRMLFWSAQQPPHTQRPVAAAPVCPFTSSRQGTTQ